MTPPGETPGMHPVDAYLNHLTIIGRSAKTIATYASVLRRAQAELPAGLLAVQEELEAWLATRRSSSTRSVYRSALVDFYRWACKRGLLVAEEEGANPNPAADLPPVKRRKGLPRPVPLDQLGRILTEARQPVRLWAAIAAYTGARCVEISRLRREDISEETIYLDGKGDKERAVPTHPALWAMVRGLPPGVVAGGRTAHRVSNRAAAEFDRLGLPDVTMHRLRHTAGTLWQAATRDVRVTQELLGHADVSTTQIYTAVSNDRLRAAVLAFPDFTTPDAEPSEGDVDQG